MRLIQSKQKDVPFVFCASPITVDKRAEWGQDPSNLQNGPNGAFLKLSSPTEISHLVQPNADRSAPIGWMPGSGPSLFTKLPIWVENERVLQPGETHQMTTKDGVLNYDVKEPALVCYNGDESGPDMSDGWVQTIANLKKNYDL